MKTICWKCGKSTEGEGITFCPYCGEKLDPEKTPRTPSGNDEAEEWIDRALKEKTIQKREKVLKEAQSLFPESRAVEWELLFIGKPRTKRYDGDFFIIKSYLLQMYRKPEDFPEALRGEMRRELFEGRELTAYLNREEDPEKAMESYLRRLCVEYIDIFLEGDNRIMGSIFGFRLERAKEKVLARPVSEMIACIEKDRHLQPEQREMLRNAMYSAFSASCRGKTEYLDGLLR